MYEKLGEVNYKGSALANMIDKGEIDFNKLNEEEINDIYLVADGHFEEIIMRNIECRTSLKNILENSIEKLEEIINNMYISLYNIYNNHTK